MVELHRDGFLCEDESGDLSLALYRGREGFPGLRDPWRQLADSLSKKRFFHLYPWYRSYLESLEKDPASVFFCVISRGSIPVGVFPLKRTERKVCGFRFRCLEIPAHDHMNLSDFIFDKTAANATLLRALVKNVRRLSGESWDLIYVPNALEDSTTAYALQRAPTFLSVTSRAKKSNYVNCDMTYDQMAENFKGSFRRNLNRLHRRASELGKLEFSSYRSTEDIQRHFHELLKVEASGWKGERGTHTAISCDESSTHFYEKVVEGFGASGQCMLNLLALNGKCIAGQLCLLVDGTLYILKIGFDESYSTIAPGNLIMSELFRQCAEDSQIKTISFITDRDWNLLWGAESMPVYDHYLFNHGTIMGWLGYLACRSKNLAQPLLRLAERKRKEDRK
ncbi:MAG: GNAT family N-acetyltransferase [Gammaproteobacteria bacterium]|nr:GNAT family N-acetyltransferase [Gammaproteobacteria bacterium]